MKANWLRTKRKQLGLSQEDLANQLQLRGYSVTSGAISHWENARYNPPLDDPGFRKTLAEILKLDTKALLSLAGYEVEYVAHSAAGVRAAFIVDQLPPEKQDLAIGILEQFLQN